MTNPVEVGALVGRDAELEQAAAVLERARTQRVASLLRIGGASGIGKTAFGREIVARAGAAGWFSASVGAHRIQATLPLVVARNIISTTVRELGEQAGRYTSGLDAEIAKSTRGELAKEAIEETLLRLTEAVSLDRPTLFFIDDAQWADRESRSLVERLMQALADRPLLLVYTERNEHVSERAFEFTDASIILRDLDIQSLETLARQLLPGANEAVILTAVQHARGRALDIVTLANSVPDAATLTSDRVAETLRSLIARDIALLDSATREFLQICSLISEPIAYALLKAVFPDEAALIEHIEACSGRYLRQDGDALHFVHAAVAQSIRETIPIEIPYRRRIIEAIQHLPSLRFEDMERLVEQAAASGDRTLEKRFLDLLLQEAERHDVLPVTARALERIIELTPGASPESLALHAKLSMTYNAMTRADDTHRVCSQALSYALAAGINEGLGQLVVSDLFALYFRGDFALFQRTLAQFDAYLSAPEDRAQLLAAKLLAALFNADEPAFEKARQEFDVLELRSPLFEIRYAIFNAYRQARTGDAEKSFGALTFARMKVQEVAPVMRLMVADANAYIAFHFYGTKHPESAAALEALPKYHETRTYLTAFEMLAADNPSDAISYISESLVHVEPFARRLLAGVAATAGALSGVEVPANLGRAIEQDANIGLRDRVTGWLRPIGAGAAVLAAKENPKWARDVLHATLDAAKTPVEPMVIFSPIVLVRAASLLNDREALERIARGDVTTNGDPWDAVQGDFAKLAARKALGETVTADSASELRMRFERLGAPLFARSAQDVFADAPRAKQETSDKKLTRREAEVASLISQGGTNREIAEKLVLSERTVEAHVANIFSKLNATSRAQVAAWYARSSAMPSFS